MNKSTMMVISNIIAMSVLWSVAFVIALKSYAGIFVGICFGIATGGFDLLLKKKRSKK